MPPVPSPLFRSPAPPRTALSRLLLGAALLTALGCGVVDATQSMTAAQQLTAASRLEAEAMSFSGNGKIFTDSSASGGKARAFMGNSSATGSFTLTAPATQLLIRAKADLCQGPPRMVVKVDGVQVVAADVTTTGWADYPGAISLAAGAHKVSVAFTNDLYKPGTCDRNLRVDYVGWNTASSAMSFEAESFAVPSGGQIFQDATASGGFGMELLRDATLTGPVDLTSAATHIAVRAKADLCQGSPRMVVQVDGAKVLSVLVPQTGWADYGADLPFKAGKHQVDISYANEFDVAPNCDRNLRLDKVSFSGGTTCTPTTCAAKGANCGSLPDGCGGTLSCGSCTAPLTCGGGGTPNVCGGATCTPTTCAAKHANCGTLPDGCGGTLSCGTCTAPLTCGGGGTANVCGGATNNPSGEPMPVGDIPGWRQVFTDDFTQNVPLGSFPSAVSSKWDAYPDGWQDTSKNGTYMPSKVISVQNGVMNLHLHTENGVHMVSAPEPKIPGAPGSEGGLLYGRYVIRFKSDPVPGYKTAWLLWPDSEVWPQDGEIDFPEGNLDSTISAFMHRQNGTSGGDQDAYDTTVTYTSWHTAVLEWGPNACTFYIDGKVIGRSTSRIPNTPMHWVIQTETNLDGYAPADSAAGNVQIDWVAVYVPK